MPGSPPDLLGDGEPAGDDEADEAGEPDDEHPATIRPISTPAITAFDRRRIPLMFVRRDEPRHSSMSGCGLRSLHVVQPRMRCTCQAIRASVRGPRRLL